MSTDLSKTHTLGINCFLAINDSAFLISNSQRLALKFFNADADHTFSLSDYVVKIAKCSTVTCNGVWSEPGTTLGTAGEKIAPYEHWTICNENAKDPINKVTGTVKCLQYDGGPAMYFDGNDGLGLFYKGVLVDIIAGLDYPVSLGDPPPNSYYVDGYEVGTISTLIRSGPLISVGELCAIVSLRVFM